MFSSRTVDDELLTRYLLGTLTEDDAERVDELSIVDDHVAWRLRAVENDLVDAYVRGDLRDETLARFRSAYLASPERRKKVMFAKGLASVEPAQVVTSSAPHARRIAWALAACIVAIVAGAAYLVFSARQHEVVRPSIVIARQRHVSAPVLPPVAIAMFVLEPPTRAASSIATIEIPAGTAKVVLRARLESAEFPSYEGALRDLATDRVLWQSATVMPRSGAVPFEVPRSILKDGDYSLEVSGVPAGKSPELIGVYAFRVVSK